MTTVRSVTVRLKADIGDFTRGLVTAGAEAKGFASQLDSSNDRMSNLIQTAVALGPALIPVLGGATVGAAALGTSLAFAATGAGVAALALDGVGSSLTALNKFQMDPTQTNLDALRLKLDQLAPAGQNFVFFLESLKPKLDALKATAQDGFLPGLTDGIEQITHSFPAVNALVGDLASTLGDLASEAGHAFESPFWQGFLADFAANASTELATFAKGIGNVTTGLAGMFEAFLPVSGDFNSELLKLSQSFSDWGQNLSDNKGFQDFVTYIRDNGPHTAEALAAIAEAFIAITRAAAPVGAAVLPVITLLANGLAAIANSPAGPVLFGLASGLAALARAVALLKVLNAPLLIGGIQKLGGPGMTAGAAQLRLMAGGVAALALSLTDLDDKAGVSNSLMGGALGFAVGGPWGAAIGGAIGLTKDLASANDDLEKSMANVNDAFTGSTVSFTAERTAFQALIAQREAYQKKLSGNGVSFWSIDPHDVGDQLTSTITHISDFFTHASDESKTATDEAAKNLQNFKGALADVAAQAGGSNADFAELSTTIQKLGYSAKDFADLFANRNRSAPDAVAWETAVRAVQDYIAAQGSVPGRTKAVNDAIAGLDDKLLSTADAAKAVKDAMDALFGPELSLSAATDQWANDLQHLKDNLDKNNKSLTGQTDGARKNREAIRGLVTDFEAVANAGAGVGETSAEFTKRLAGMYQSLVKAGVGANLSKKQLTSYLETLNLTPKEITTLVKLFGAQDAQKQSQDLVDAYNALPLSLRTDIATNGWPTTMAQVKALQARYNLTPKQVRTLLQAIDHATGPIQGVKAQISDLDGRSATVSINVVTTQTQINKVLNQLGSGQGTAQADGSVLDFYRNGGLRENHVAQIAPAGSYRIWGEPETGGEAYIPFAPSKRARSRSIADETVSRLGGAVQWMANGGIGQYGGGSTSTVFPVVTPDQLAGAVAAALNGSELTLADRNGALVGMIHTGARTVVDSAAAFTEQQRRAKPPTR